MGFASYYEDNLDARSETLRGRHLPSILSKKETKKTQQKRSVQSHSTLRKKYMESQFTLERKPNSTRTLRPKKLRPKQPPKLLRRKASHNTRQDIRSREPQEMQHDRVQKTPHVTFFPPREPQKTQRVTTEEIQRRIQREIIRQSALKKQNQKQPTE